MASPTTNGTGPNGKSALEADISLLQSLLVQGPNLEESDIDVTEILRRLEAADGIATGLETRLDGIMDSIDDMLGALEPKGQSVELESAVVRQGDAAVEEQRVVAVATMERVEQREHE